MTIDYHHEHKMQDQEYYPAKRVENYYIPIGFKSHLPRKVESILLRGAQRLVGRKIIEYRRNQGDYGDGAGPGFLGLLLEEDKDQNLKKELLVVTINSADCFTLMDGNWMYASAPFRKTHVGVAERPAIGQPSPFDLIVGGSTIKEADLQPEYLKVKIQSTDGKEHQIEILNKDPRLSPYANLKPAVAMKPGDHIGNYIIFMEENGQIYV